MRLPLIIRQPGGPRGITNTAFVSRIDSLPTFLDFAGVKSPTNPAAPARLGRSFLPVLEQSSLPPNEWQEVFGSHTFSRVTNYYPHASFELEDGNTTETSAGRLTFLFGGYLCFGIMGGDQET